MKWRNPLLLCESDTTYGTLANIPPNVIHNIRLERARVCCVLLAYNAASIIERALVSIAATLGITKTVVVDDGSDSDTGMRVAAFAVTALLLVYLIRQTNTGKRLN